MDRRAASLKGVASLPCQRIAGQGYRTRRTPCVDAALASSFPARLKTPTQLEVLPASPTNTTRRFGWGNKHSSARASSGGCLGWSRLLRDLCASKNVLRPERHGFPLSPLRQIPIPARSRDAITPKITDQNANRKCNSSPDRRVQNHAQPPIGIVPLRPGRFNRGFDWVPS